MKDICGKALGSALYQNRTQSQRETGIDHGDDADYTSLRSDSELEDQLIFIVARRCRRPTSPSIPTIIVVTLLTVGIAICIFVFEPR